jgi:hypothetical protein
MLRRNLVAGDKRRVQLALTEHGERCLALAPGPAEGILPKALLGVSESSLRALHGHLHKVVTRSRPTKCTTRFEAATRTRTKRMGFHTHPAWNTRGKRAHPERVSDIVCVERDYEPDPAGTTGRVSGRQRTARVRILCRRPHVPSTNGSAP